MNPTTAGLGLIMFVGLLYLNYSDRERIGPRALRWSSLAASVTGIAICVYVLAVAA